MQNLLYWTFFLYGGGGGRSKHSIQILLLHRPDLILKSVPPTPTSKILLLLAGPYQRLKIFRSKSFRIENGEWQKQGAFSSHSSPCTNSCPPVQWARTGLMVALRVTMPEMLPSAQLCCANPLSLEHTGIFHPRGCCQLLQFLSPRFRSPAQLRTQTLKATLKQSTESPKFPFGKQKNKIRCSANISHPITKVFFLSQTSHRPKPPSQRHLPRELQGFNRQITPGSAFSPLTSYLLNNLHLDNLLL